MKKVVFLCVSFFISTFLLFSQGKLDEGIGYLKSAQQAKREGRAVEERDFLQKAYDRFSEGTGEKSVLLRIYAGARLGQSIEVEDVAKNYLLENKERYKKSISKLGMIDREFETFLLDFLTSIESRIPFIDSPRAAQEEIHPYSEDRPAVKFHLNTSAELRFSLNGQLELRENFSTGGEKELSWEWKDEYLEKKTISLDFKTTNDFANTEKIASATFETSMPAGLVFRDSGFQITDKEFKRITKKAKPQFGFLLYPLIGMGFDYLLSTPIYKSHGMTYIWSGLGLIGFIGSVIKVINKSDTYDLANIKDNQRLKEEIERRKKDIRTKMIIGEANKPAAIDSVSRSKQGERSS